MTNSRKTWQWMLQDGLGSVRSVLDNDLGVLQMGHYAPYGEVWHEQGTAQIPFGFTGEPTDPNNLVHLRARYYNPTLGVFPNLDPVEGDLPQNMSFNRYAYVGSNPIMQIDPSGLIGEDPNQERNCASQTATDSCAVNGGGGVSLFGDGATIYPDRIDKSFLNTWGVVLTVECKADLSNVYWTQAQKNNLQGAISVIDGRLQSPRVGSSFKEVFGALEIRHIYQFQNAAIGAIAQSKNRIEISRVGRDSDQKRQAGVYSSTARDPQGTGFYGLDNPNDRGIQATIVHELGHILDYRTGSAMSRFADDINHRIPAIGNPGTNAHLRENLLTPGDPVEKVADHFLNWVYNSYIGVNPDEHNPTANLDGRRTTEFWLGTLSTANETIEYEGKPTGIKVWADAAGTFARRLPSLIAYINAVQTGNRF